MEDFFRLWKYERPFLIAVIVICAVFCALVCKFTVAPVYYCDQCTGEQMRPVRDFHGLRLCPHHWADARVLEEAHRRSPVEVAR